MSAQPFRLAAGGAIDRARPLAFTFNGRRLTGHAGDSLASALLANGVRLVARSFKYHRPRGIFSAGIEEPNALLQIGTGGREDPNMPATMVALHDGLIARSANCWPGVGLDLGAVNDRLGGLLPAGFYYKTFMAPARLWPRYEAAIRAMAGIGGAPSAPDPDRYEDRHDHPDLLIVGGGPAGLAAALAAGRAGARVLLMDAEDAFGGALRGEGEIEIAGSPARDWVAGAGAELAAMPHARLVPRTTVFGYYEHNYLAALERVTDGLGADAPDHLPRQRLWKIRARRVVLATGAHERPLVFADNDRPGIMLAAAARTYVNRFAVRPGTRAVVFTNNDSAYGAAFDLARAGVGVAAIVDPRPAPSAALTEQTRAAGIELLAGHVVVRARGYRQLRAVDIAPFDGKNERLAGAVRRLPCDLLCVSGGWSPAVHLHSQSGGGLRFDDACAAFLPAAPRQAARSAGAANGVFALADILREGAEAGAAAVREIGFSDARPEAPAAAPPPEEAPLLPLWRVPPPRPGARQFVDLFSDVTAEDVALAHREGYVSVEHFKRYTTAGMGADQGKTGNLNALALLARARGAAIPEVGTTTFRPPYAPVAFGALAGRRTGTLYAPLRKTAIDPWHAENGAVFEDFGPWRRPQYYARNGAELAEAAANECRAVRTRVGLIDVSTLGKIDIQGPDALTLLNRVTINRWDSPAVGRCRYGVMLGEDGMVKDDGVTARLGEHHYHMTTTSGGAAGIYAWLEEWLQGEWPDLAVYLTPVTTQWAAVAVAGPEARTLLARLAPDIDLDAARFPFMAVREGVVAGIPARLFTVSFTGEHGYEINVPARYGEALWEVLMDAGRDLGVVPCGVEAMDMMRVEKGHFVIGRDTDGTVNPIDLGLARMIGRKKRDFIGKRSLARSDATRANRLQLVGLIGRAEDPVLPEGAQIVAEAEAAPPMEMIGHVTSSIRSPTLGRPIALALLAGGHDRHGESVTLWSEDRVYHAEVASPRFYDPEGKRLTG